MGSLSAIGGGNSSDGGPRFRHGRWVTLNRPGLSRSEVVQHRGWRIEVRGRRVGITIHRTLFAATMTAPFPPFKRYLSGFRDVAAALKAATTFVDEWHEENGHLLETEAVAGMRRKKMAKRLFKIRSIRRRSRK